MDDRQDAGQVGDTGRDTGHGAAPILGVAADDERGLSAGEKIAVPDNDLLGTPVDVDTGTDSDAGAERGDIPVPQPAAGSTAEDAAASPEAYAPTGGSSDAGPAASGTAGEAGEAGRVDGSADGDRGEGGSPAGGPERPGPWGTDAPTRGDTVGGAAEDSPLGEGSEQTAAGGVGFGDRRAAPDEP
jgi:hypothetical protein